MCCVMITSHVRPGRPPKRVLPFPAPSPQDAMLQLNRSPLVPQDNFSRWVSSSSLWPPPSPSVLREAGGHPLDGGRFPGGPGGGSFPGGHPMTAAGAAHLMSLNNPAALLSRTGMCDVWCNNVTMFHDILCRNAAGDAWRSGGVTWSASSAWRPRPPGDLQAAVWGLRQASAGVSDLTKTTLASSLPSAEF